MKKKGFTLIELLAIIVILGIIAVITVPQILNVVENSKKEAAKDSAYGYKNAIYQFYLNESANDSELDMDGNYSIENGVITNGSSSFNVDVSGRAPSSGDVKIKNGDVVEGCISYGDYSAVIENGNVVDMRDGGCYNISYFTYDPEADMSEEYYHGYDGSPTYGIYGHVTSKVSTPDPSWLYYIKEIEIPYKDVYAVDDLVYDDSYVVGASSSIESCQQFIIDEFEEYASDFECRSLGTYKKYELCFVIEGDEYCAEPFLESNQIDALYSHLDNTYDICFSEGSGLACSNRDATDMVGFELMFDSGLSSIAYFDHIDLREVNQSSIIPSCGVRIGNIDNWISGYWTGEFPSLAFCDNLLEVWDFMD